MTKNIFLSFMIDKLQVVPTGLKMYLQYISLNGSSGIQIESSYGTMTEL
jgi:hypothetical protein